MILTEQKNPNTGHEGAPTPTTPPPRELSLARVAVLLVAIAGLVFGAWRLIAHDASAADETSDAVPVYAPYVDVTLTPTYPFQSPSANPVSSAYLGFVVSKPSSPCTPSWGGYYTLAQAAQALDLDARIAQLRKQGGSAMVSFGGQDNTELAVDCTSPAKLAKAYLAPIERYRVTTIDLDIEGSALADQAANVRRAKAIATIQRQMVSRHTPLHVWMTLPVSSAGLTAEGVAAVRAMLAAHVTLAGVNAMAMDFGAGEGAASHMVATIERALDATHAQVQSLWHAAGLESSAGSAWEHLGVTVMLGVNDVTNERFTTADARKLRSFVRREGIPRVSAWSLNRDSECGGAFPKVGVVSNTCSGVLQSSLEFTHIFSRLAGTRTARNQQTVVSPTQPQASTSSNDDPASSPYPIWQPTAAYVTGYKVVWQGEIYEAKWWSQGTAPGSEEAEASADPWLLIGPVSPGSRAPKPTLLASGHYQSWSPGAVYREGQRVLFKGLPFQARFYTRGEQPSSALPGSPSSPWEALFTDPGEPADTGIGAGTS
jgi:chitinase